MRIFFQLPGKSLLIAFCFFLCATCSVAIGQRIQLEVPADYQVSSYTLGEEEGLRGNLPHFFLQDHRGYIWILVDGWVQRYNGTEFETFFRIPRHHDTVTSLMEDSEGKIWVIKHQVHDYLDGVFNNFEIWRIDPKTRNIENAEDIWSYFKFDFLLEDVRAFSEFDRQGGKGILLGLRKGRVIHIDSTWRTIFQFSDQRPVFRLKTNQSGAIAINTEKEITIIDFAGNLLKKHTGLKPLDYFDLTDDLGVFGKFAGERPPAFFLPFNGEFQSYYPPFNLDLEKTFSLTWEITNDSFLVLRNHILKKGRKDPLVICKECPQLFLDEQNNIWTSNFKGLTVFRLQPKLFKTLLANEGIETRGILLLEDSVLMVNSYKGGYLLDLDGNKLRHNKNMNAMIGISRDSRGRIWAGAHGPNIHWIDNYRENFKEDKKQWGSQIIKIPLAVDGGVWWGCQQGLAFCETGTGANLETCFWVEHPILKQASIHYLEKQNGKLWAATSKGLFTIDPQSRQVIAHYDQLATLDINYFARKDSVFWLSTYYSGLVKWKLGEADFDQFSLVEDSLFMEPPALCAVYDDGLGHLWIPSGNGLYRFRKSDHRYQKYNRNHNIAHNEFNFYSHARLPDGRLIFGGLNGLTLVDPNLLGTLDRELPAVSLQISDAFISDDASSRQIFIGDEQPIILTGQKEVLKMDCFLLDYRSMQPGQIWYKLEGLDIEWHILAGHTLKLERIPYGDYRLKLKAITFDKFSTSQVIEIPVIVRKPWFRTSFATGAFILLVCASGGGLMALRYSSIRTAKKNLEETVRQRTREIEANKDQILKQNEELKSLNDYKDKIMAIMGHDLRGPILGLSNLGDKMKYLLKQGDIDRMLAICYESERQIDQLRMLIDNLLVWSLLQNKNSLNTNPSRVNLWAVIKDQIDLLTANANVGGHDFRLDADPDINFESEEFVLAILTRNLIANSIRYSRKATPISIKVHAPAGVPTIIIEDEGTGMEESLREALNRCEPLTSPFQRSSQKGLGLGLWICSSLLKKLKGKWYFSSPVNGEGLNVRLWFPESILQQKETNPI